jgi:hypothetical protein
MAKQRILRFPRFSPEELNGLAGLENRATELIGRRRKVRIALGRIFRCIKKKVGHGYWESYFQAKFEDKIGLRTVETYMRMAHPKKGSTQRADSKNADSALFPLATDPEAAQRRKDREHAQAEVAEAAKKHPSFRVIFRLNSLEDKHTAERHRPVVEKKLNELLNNLCDKLRTVNKEAA